MGITDIIMYKTDNDKSFQEWRRKSFTMQNKPADWLTNMTDKLNIDKKKKKKKKKKSKNF